MKQINPRGVRLPRRLNAAGEHLQRALRSPLGMRLRMDSAYRTEIGLYISLFATLFYAALKMILGAALRSLWFGALAGYYLLLVILRLFLLHALRRAPAGMNLLSEWRCYRLCGITLLLMNQALSVLVVFVVHRGNGFAYPGYLIYAAALYTFYSFIHALRDMAVFKKRGSPILSAAKAVSFVSALVSLLSLETAMIAQFGSGDDPMFRLIMTGCTGAAVCVIVLGMAIYMIARSTQQLRLLRSEVFYIS